MLLLLAVAAATLATAEDSEIEALLAKQRAAYGAVRTAKISVRVFRRTRRGPRIFTGTLLYAAPTNIKAALYEGTALTYNLTSDGRYINSGSGRLLRQRAFNPDAFSTVLPINLECINFWDAQRQMNTGDKGNMFSSALRLEKNVAWAGRKWIVLNEESEVQNVICRYFIDPKTFFIYRTVVTSERDGEVNTDSVITKLELNAKVNLALFHIEPLGMDGP